MKCQVLLKLLFFKPIQKKSPVELKILITILLWISELTDEMQFHIRKFLLGHVNRK